MSAPQQRRGLGRGLGALIPTAPRPVAPPPHDAPEAPSSVTSTADWIGTPLPGEAGVVVPNSPAGLDSDTDTGVDSTGSDSHLGVGDGAVPGAVEARDSGATGPAAGSWTSAATAHAVDAQERVPVDGLTAAWLTANAPERGHHQDGSVGESARAAERDSEAADTGDAAVGVDAGAWFAELPIDEIRANPRQPREVFDEEAMAELVASITEVGLLQPVVVRPVDDGYELVMGERRWRATREAGLRSIPAIVRETADDDLLRDALLENLHRAQLNALEEAAAYQQLLEDFGCTHDELASRIGRSRPQISNTLRLLKLPPAVQRRVAAGVLSAGHARALLAVPDADQQDRLAARVVAEGISVRSLEELVAVGDGARPAATARRSTPTAPGVEHLATRLSDRLDTRVRVELGRRKGRITVDFATLSDLERIVALIDGRMEAAEAS